MPSDAIFDKFGSRLSVGDWILYVPVDPDGYQRLSWGQIKSFQNLNMYGKSDREDWIINIVTDDGNVFTQRHLSVKFTEEEMTMRKLESGL